MGDIALEQGSGDIDLESGGGSFALEGSSSSTGGTTGPFIPGNRPFKRVIDIRSLAFGLSGPERPYPVYQFSGYRVKIERPGHNPFLHVPPFY